MKDHEKRELVSELVGIARISHGTEQLRDRIAYALGGVFSELDEATARAERAEAELKTAREPLGFVRKHDLAHYRLTDVGHVPVFSQPAGDDEYLPVYASPVPAPAAQVPHELKEELMMEFPLLDEEGLCQELHHCEWAIQQERKRLHSILQEAKS